MEGSKNLNRLTAIIIIIAFHAVGLFGLNFSPFKNYFLPLVPYHLLLMLGVLVFSHRGINLKLFFFIVLVFVVGYAAEWVGVHTGLLFGNYAYGNTLGRKIDGVPIIIGVNWFILIYSAGVFMQRRFLKKRWMRIVFGAFALSLLDVLIEPSAIRFNYWHWADNVVPITNYLCWFVLSAVLLLVFEQIRFRRQSIVGEVFLMVEFAFFALLLV